MPGATVAELVDLAGDGAGLAGCEVAGFCAKTVALRIKMRQTSTGAIAGRKKRGVKKPFLARCSAADGAGKSL